MIGNDIHVDVAIIGAGTAGANALREVKRAGKTFVLIDQGPLGTTCARVGCMPSKAVLHAGALSQGHIFSGASHGTAVEANSPYALWSNARKTRDLLASEAAARIVTAAGDHLILGRARFIEPNVVDVGRRRIMANAFVIATGSRPVVPSFLKDLQDRVLTTDSLFELGALPRSIGIIGLGAIGVEMGVALSRLGVEVVAADMKSFPAGITDPEIGARAIKHFTNIKGMTVWLGGPTHIAQSDDHISMSSYNAMRKVEWVLAALGRRPSLEDLQLEAAGVMLDAEGFPYVDPCTMQIGETALYLAGDVVPERPLQHEAADEGLIAGWNAAHHRSPRRFKRRVPLSIVFSDPDVASIGTTFDQLDAEQVIIGSSSGQTNGRSRILGAEGNLVRIYAERSTGLILGAAIFSARGEHVAHLLAWAIQRGETAQSLLQMPFYHPTIEEMVQTALADIVGQRAGAHTGPVGLQAAD